MDQFQYESSIFDSNNEQEILQFQLWKKGDSTKKPQDIILEGQFMRESYQKGLWKEKTYTLTNNKLYCIDESGYIISYIELDYVRIQKIKFGNKNKLHLRHGLRFFHNYQYSDLYSPQYEIVRKWFKQLKKFCISTTFFNDYQPIKLLGQGSSAKVYYCRSKSTGNEYAVKIFLKNKLENLEEDIIFIMKEIQISRLMSYKGVINMYKVYEDSKYIFLVFELLTGGELYKRLKSQVVYDESQARLIMFNIFKALAYVHSKNVMHRDLKPENLILRTTTDFELCLVDFGLADFFYSIETEKNKYKRCGTPGYVAPEILQNKNYDYKVDVFSAGIIMYELLTGTNPFYDKSQEIILQNNKKCNINLENKNISYDAKDLLQLLLIKDPKLRYDSTQALNHNWFVQSSKIFQSETIIQIEEDNFGSYKLDNFEIFNREKRSSTFKSNNFSLMKNCTNLPSEHNLTAEAYLISLNQQKQKLRKTSERSSLDELNLNLSSPNRDFQDSILCFSHQSILDSRSRDNSNGDICFEFDEIQDDDCNFQEQMNENKYIQINEI